MDSKGKSENTKHTVWNAFKTGVFGVFLTIVLGSACAPQKPAISPEQEKRLETMKSEASNASLTVLPVRVGGTPYDRATEFIGMQLEQKGLKNIELGKVAFDPGNQTDLAQVAISLSEFVKKAPITTGYALYAEVGGKGGLDEIRTIVVTKSGALVWSDRVTPRDTPWKERGGDRDLLVACTVLAEHVAPQFGLNEETAKAATPGKMTAIMAERSGLPPENETAAIPGRQEVMKKAIPHATLVVYSGRTRTADNPAETGNAVDLAKMITDAGLCNASPASQPLLLTASQADPNEMKVMWDLAREFREHARKNPVDADYVLYADYRFNPQMWEAGFVHLIVCDRQGEWVIADLRNSHHPDYQRVKPTCREDCDKILVEFLRGYLQGSATSTNAVPTALNSDVAGKYYLISAAGQPIPTPRAEGDQSVQILSSTLTLNRDGTFVSTYNYGETPGWPSTREFKGRYAKQGEEYALTWEGAGQTAVRIDGPKLAMNNEGAVFIYWKEGAPRVSIETKRVEGALEAERMAVLGKTGGNAREQRMEWFGTEWSGDNQLWWTEAKPGDKLDLGLDVRQPGTYRLSAQFTKAIDYGIAQLYLDGEKIKGPIDLYNDRVIVSGVVDLGNHELDARQHKLTVEVVGTNPHTAQGYMVGIDYVKLEPVGNVATTSAAVAQPPMDAAEAQMVLDQLLGTWCWNWEVTVYPMGSSPEDKHATGRSSCTRVLRGSFVQETTEDSEGNSSLVLYNYDQRQQRYRSWLFESKWGGPEVPFDGKWNNATRTLDWICRLTDGVDTGCSISMQHRFISDDAFECSSSAKDRTGRTLWSQGYKNTRAKETQNPNQPATGSSTPILSQTAEQKVLDRFLGTWNEEKIEYKAKWTPEEKHTTRTCNFTRILDGKFVQQTVEDSEKNSGLQLITFDEQRKCYRFWNFGSNIGGPEAPRSANWNEEARTFELFDFPASGGPKPTCQIHFVSDNETDTVYMVQDPAGETLYRTEFKMTRIGGPQK